MNGLGKILVICGTVLALPVVIIGSLFAFGVADDILDSLGASGSTSTSSQASPGGAIHDGDDPLPEGDEEMFEALIENQPSLYNYGDLDALIDAADAVCDGFTSGLDDSQVMDVLMDTGFTAFDSGYFTQMSVSVYCPEHEYLIED